MAKPAPLHRSDEAIVAIGPKTEISDADLVTRARGGDRWAEEALFRRYAPLVLTTATRLAGNRADGEDVAQETFALALERLPSLRDPAAFRGWLLRIAFSRVHRVFRRRRWMRLFGFESPPEHTLLDWAAHGVSPSVATELRLLSEALDDLPREQRMAWLLRRVEGLSISEVAEACERSAATVKRWIDAVDARVSRHVEDP